MKDVNVVVLVGRLTRDAELKYTTSGMAICHFSVAVNRNRKQGDQWIEEAGFFDVDFFGKGGEAVNQYLVKGKQVAIEGELRQDKWEQDGQSRSKVIINASNVQLLGSAGGQGGQGGSAGGGSFALFIVNAGQVAPAVQVMNSVLTAGRGGNGGRGGDGGNGGNGGDGAPGRPIVVAGDCLPPSTQ